MIFMPVDDALHILNEPSSWHHMIALSLWSYLLDDGVFWSLFGTKKLQKVHFETVSYSQNVFILVFYYDGCDCIGIIETDNLSVLS